MRRTAQETEGFANEIPLPATLEDKPILQLSGPNSLAENVARAEINVAGTKETAESGVLWKQKLTTDHGLAFRPDGDKPL